MEDVIRFILSGKPEYIKVARIGAGTIASNAGFDVDDVDDIKLAVEEACKLISCHGHEALTNQYEVKFEIAENSITITVQDSNEGRDVQKTCRQCKNCPEEGNLSSLVMKTLMDEVTIDTLNDDLKSIIMVKKNGKLRSF